MCWATWCLFTVLDPQASFTLTSNTDLRQIHSSSPLYIQVWVNALYLPWNYTTNYISKNISWNNSHDLTNTPLIDLVFHQYQTRTISHLANKKLGWGLILPQHPISQFLQQSQNSDCMYREDGSWVPELLFFSWLFSKNDFAWWMYLTLQKNRLSISLFLVGVFSPNSI